MTSKQFVPQVSSAGDQWGYADHLRIHPGFKYIAWSYFRERMASHDRSSVITWELEGGSRGSLFRTFAEIQILNLNSKVSWPLAPVLASPTIYYASVLKPSIFVSSFIHFLLIIIPPYFFSQPSYISNSSWSCWTRAANFFFLFRI